MVKQLAHDKLIIGQVQSEGFINKKIIIYNYILINTKNHVFIKLIKLNIKIF